MAVLSSVACSCAIANDSTFVNVAQSAVLASIRAMARIYQLTIVK
jgi:hypothetical protein